MAAKDFALEPCRQRLPVPEGFLRIVACCAARGVIEREARVEKELSTQLDLESLRGRDREVVRWQHAEIAESLHECGHFFSPGMRSRSRGAALLNGVQQFYDAPFELLGSDVALGHELRRAETEPLFILRCKLLRGVDDERYVAQSILSA